MKIIGLIAALVFFLFILDLFPKGSFVYILLLIGGFLLFGTGKKK